VTCQLIRTRSCLHSFISAAKRMRWHSHVFISARLVSGHFGDAFHDVCRVTEERGAGICAAVAIAAFLARKSSVCAVAIGDDSAMGAMTGDDEPLSAGNIEPRRQRFAFRTCHKSVHLSCAGIDGVDADAAERALASECRRRRREAQ
jgi:hypothetical protein